MKIAKQSKKIKRASRIDRKIYSMTSKPTCYKELENPPITKAQKLANPQDARQEQFNRWCKAVKYYSGSYLPIDTIVLKKRNSNWIKPKGCCKNKNSESLYNKNTKQNVRYDKEFLPKQSHWHWLNWDKEDLKGESKENSYKESSDKAFYDKYGNMCSKNKAKQKKRRILDNSNNKYKYNHHIGINGVKYDK